MSFLERKRKIKQKRKFIPAENNQTAHFRRGKRKRISVGSSLMVDLTDPNPSDFTTDLRQYLHWLHG